jgi:hypothetical protein
LFFKSLVCLKIFNHIILFGLSCKWIEREKNNFEENLFDEKKKIKNKTDEQNSKILSTEEIVSATTPSSSSSNLNNENINSKKTSNRQLSRRLIISSRFRNRRFVYFSSYARRILNKNKPVLTTVES